MVVVGGDRVAVSARSLSVKGRTVPVAGPASATAARGAVEIVPPGRVFLLGDNAAAWIDRRSLGAVPMAQVVAALSRGPGCC